jgi:hypothetical protein
VPIVNATFDRGGYQLQDTAGETIVVPFANNSMCALKFGVSTTGNMYFVNAGDAPVLYVPSQGYLENATAPGARWYPFYRNNYVPSQPVYMSVAPNVTNYYQMGWYPGMYCYGGYESDVYLGGGVSFGLGMGLSFLIGGQNYNGWSSYSSYYHHHHSDYQMGYRNQQAYTWAARTNTGRSFAGNARIWAHRTNTGASRQIRTMAPASGANKQNRAATTSAGARKFQGANPAYHANRVNSNNVSHAAVTQSNRKTTVRAVQHGSNNQSFKGAGQAYNTRRQSNGGNITRSSGANARRQFSGGGVRQQSGGNARQQSGGGGEKERR